MAKPFKNWYRGRRMRSKIEAKWGVFFDHVGWKWEHEGEGYYVLGDGSCYLPDFYVIGAGWHEIKGDAQGKFERELAMMYDVVKMEDKEKPGYFLAGYIPDPDPFLEEDKELLRVGIYDKLVITYLDPSGYRSTDVGFCVCEECGQVGIETQARAALVCDREHMDDIDVQNGNHPKLLKAFAAAQAYNPQAVPQYKAKS